jgi:hypothetical protein
VKHHRILVSSVAVGVIALALSACATLHPPAKTTGPAASGDGVELAVVRQSCQRSHSPDQPDTYLIEETIELEVRSSTPLEIRRDAFRLVTPGGASLHSVTWGSAEPLAVAASQPQKFELRFQANGARDCTDPVKLMPEQAVRRAGTPVALGEITFTPVAKL